MGAKKTFTPRAAQDMVAMRKEAAIDYRSRGVVHKEPCVKRLHKLSIDVDEALYYAIYHHVKTPESPYKSISDFMRAAAWDKIKPHS